MSATNRLKIATIPGDGIGREVVPEGMRVLEAVGRRFDIGFQFDEVDWSCEYYKKHGRMMPFDFVAEVTCLRCRVFASSKA